LKHDATVQVRITHQARSCEEKDQVQSDIQWW